MLLGHSQSNAAWCWYVCMAVPVSWQIPACSSAAPRCFPGLPRHNCSLPLRQALSTTSTLSTPPPWPGRRYRLPTIVICLLPDPVMASQLRGASSLCTGDRMEAVSEVNLAIVKTARLTILCVSFRSCRAFTPLSSCPCCSGEAYQCVWGQYCMHQMGQQYHLGTWAGKIHWHWEELRLQSDSEWWDAPFQGPDLGPAGVNSSSAWCASMCRAFSAARRPRSSWGLCPQEGLGLQCYQVEPRLLLTGICCRLGEPRPELSSD